MFKIVQKVWLGYEKCEYDYKKIKKIKKKSHTTKVSYWSAQDIQTHASAFQFISVWTPHFGSCVSHSNGELDFISKNWFLFD